MAREFAKSFYAGSAWLNKRADVLRRDNYECQRCKSKGKFSKAECVHHVKHLKDRPDLALVDSNLISLCNTCHQYEHPEKLHANVIKRRVVSNERW